MGRCTLWSVIVTFVYILQWQCRVFVCEDGMGVGMYRVTRRDSKLEERAWNCRPSRHIYNGPSLGLSVLLEALLSILIVDGVIPRACCTAKWLCFSLLV
ncbi:hypothetical protein BJX61DRAFT_521373 [Aspergillus egyptiacus]|nr:hypothetical protein BJX61DRAFT_521373 [Aspergillus egyptiacus]